MLSATVRCFGGGAPTNHRVRDLSAGGVRIDQAGAIKVGATLLVSVGALEAVGATVKWVADGWAGLAFAEEIDPDRARMRAAIAPRNGLSPPARREPASAAAAGWVADLRNPYGR
jgi:hypothetical protein